jgi:predicted nucleotidyltransferase
MPDTTLAGAARTDSSADERFIRTLDETLEVLRGSGVPFAIIGGIASSILGRDRWTRDIDVLVPPEAADAVLRAFADHGFETERVAPDWLFKASRRGVPIDIIFRSSGGMELDDEMLERTASRSFRGLDLPVPAPEDLIVMKALAAGEETPRYWHDAVAIASSPGLDWDYLLARARRRDPHRVASLLLFARSEGAVVPMSVIASLIEDGRD